MRLNPTITILGMTKSIVQEWTELGELKTDEEINDAMEFRIMDNLPMVKGKYMYS